MTSTTTTTATATHIELSETSNKPIRLERCNHLAHTCLSITILAIVIIVALVLIGLIIYLLVATSGSKDSLSSCSLSSSLHETYELTREGRLGNYSRFAVAVDNRECSTIGRVILEKGGSAVDAAIAAGLCNSVMNAQSMGIGGGHFMNIYIKSSNKSYLIDARETAPSSAYRDMFVGRPEKARFGGLATAIPGEIYGYYKAHQLAGKLPWRELFKPAIKLCEEGFSIPKALAKALKQNENIIKNVTSLRDIFVNPSTNSVYAENDTIRLSKLANTFKNISENGYETFYRGPLASVIVSEINKNGGNVTIDDFKRYEPRVHQDRFVIKLDDHLRIYTLSPPSSGVLIPTILRIMKTLGGLDTIAKMSSDSLNKFYHRLIETFKHVYAKRNSFGDEAFVNMTLILKEINDQKYIDDIASKIDDKRTMPESYYGSIEKSKGSGTC